MTKKFKIGLIIAAVAVLGLIGAAAFNGMGKHKASNKDNKVDVVKIDQQRPITSKGKVSVSRIRKYNYNPEKGKINEVYVVNGQKVNAGEPLFRYYNKQIQEQIDDLNRQLNRLYNQRSKAQEVKQAAEAAAAAAASQVPSGGLEGAADNQAGQASGSTQASQTAPQATPPQDQGAYNWSGQGQVNQDGTWNGQGTITPQSTKGYQRPVIQYLQPAKGQYAFQKMADTSDYSGVNSFAGGDTVGALNEQIEDLEIKVNRLTKDAGETIYADATGTVAINEDGKTDAKEDYIKIYSDDLVVESKINEFDYFAVEQGKKVKVFVNAEEREIDGEIIEFNDLKNADSLSTPGQTSGMGAGNPSEENHDFPFTVKLSEDLPVGFSVQIRIPRKHIVVPDTAIIKENKKEYVYLVSHNKVKKQEIKREKIGIHNIVKRGLKKGDLVVVAPSQQVKERETIQTHIINEKDEE